MVFEVLPTTKSIDFYPSTTAAEVLQNVRTIISTPKYSVPLDRFLGIDFSVLDQPVQVAQAKLADDIIRAVNDYEPRAEITSITFTVNSDGIVFPKVMVKLDDQ